MLVPSVVEVPIILPKREMNWNQWFRPINAESTFELDKVGKGPWVIDDTSGSSWRSPHRTTTTTPVDLDDITDGDSLFNEHSEFLSNILDRSEASLDNSSISTRTANTFHRDSTMTFSFNQERRESATRSSTRHEYTTSPLAPIIIQDPSTIEAALPPRRPRSAYIYFLKSVRDKNLAAVKTRRERLMNMDILLDTVDAKWNALAPHEREIFERQSADDNHRYQRELKEYERLQSTHSVGPKPLEEDSFQSNNRKRGRCELIDDVAGSASISQDCARKRTSPPSRPLPSRKHAYILGEIAPPFQTMHRRPPPPSPHPVPPKYPVSCREPALQENVPLLDGTEVELTVSHQKRKYRVQYQCISMTKAQAEDYVRKLSHGRLSMTTIPHSQSDREHTTAHA